MNPPEKCPNCGGKIFYGYETIVNLIVDGDIQQQPLSTEGHHDFKCVNCEDGHGQYNSYASKYNLPLMVNPKTITVSTHAYIKEMGKSPRGMGCWAFHFEGDDQTHWFYKDKATDYRNAEKLARFEASKLGITSIQVLP